MNQNLYINYSATDCISFSFPILHYVSVFLSVCLLVWPSMNLHFRQTRISHVSVGCPQGPYDSPLASTFFQCVVVVVIVVVSLLFIYLFALR